MRRYLPLALMALFVIFMVALSIAADSGYGERLWWFLDYVPYGDKLGHVVLIGMLSFLCNLSFPPKRRDGYRRFFTTTSLVLLVIVTADEVAQGIRPHRTMDFHDWLANVLGVVIGQVAAARFWKRPLAASDRFEPEKIDQSS